MRSILIDPYERVVREVATSGKFEGPDGLYELISGPAPYRPCELVQYVLLDARTELWLDEEGRCHDPVPPSFTILGQTHVGRGVLLTAGKARSRPLDERIVVELIAQLTHF